MRRVAVVNLGCKVSQYDGEAMAAELEAHGHRRVQAVEDADVVVVNTCTVTNRADSDARKLIRKIHRTNPSARVVVTGCLAQRAPEAVAGLSGVELVVGNTGKAGLASLMEEGARGVLVSGEFSSSPFTAPIVGPRPGKSRAFLKIQEGCEQRCTYCIVPSVRGPERSLPLERVAAEVERLVALGYPEIVLCGVHLGSWGRDIGRSLAELVTVLDGLPGRFRIRLSSIEPWGVDEGLLTAMAGSPRVARHLHLPLQSGCDATLERMGRPYTTEDFAGLLAQVRRHLPGATVGTDLIVGFPGEDDREFEATMEFLRAQPIDLAHVFPYSPREGTPAAAREAPPQRVARDRLGKVQELFARRREAWLHRHVGRRLEVVTLGAGEGCTRALAETYAPVCVQGELPPASLVEVRVTAVSGRGLSARPAGVQRL